MFSAERPAGRSGSRLTAAVPCRLPPSDRTRGQADEAAATADRSGQAFVGGGASTAHSQTHRMSVLLALDKG